MLARPPLQLLIRIIRAFGIGSLAEDPAQLPELAKARQEAIEAAGLEDGLMRAE